MATAVVAGRVEEDIKRTADAIIRASGKTASDVIAGLWAHIAITGEVPGFATADEGASKRAEQLDDFFSFVDSLPPAPCWLADMDRASARDMIASRYV